MLSAAVAVSETLMEAKDPDCRRASDFPAEIPPTDAVNS
jgi:hypothetical protein